MKLFHMPGACSLADLIVLQWIGASYETVRMNLDSLKSPEYLAINPGGSVPLLVEGDIALTENVAILGYLADLHPAARLLGDGSPRGRAKVMRWVGFLNSDVHKAFKPIFAPQRFLEEPAFAQALAQNARAHVREYLERLDAELEGREWLTGERSIADPYLFVVLRWSASKQVVMRGLDNLTRLARKMDNDVGVRAALAAEADESASTYPAAHVGSGARGARLPFAG